MSALLMRAVIVSIVLLAGSVTLAAPYNGQPFKYQQPDGSEITVYVYGDEFLAYGETEDGYIVTKDPKTGFFCYAKLKPDGSEIISTGVRVGRAKPAGLKPKLRYPRAVANAKHKSRRELLGFDDRGRMLSRQEVEEDLVQRAASEEGVLTGGDEPIALAPPALPTINKRVSLVLLASFPDRPGDITKTQSEVDDFANATGYTTGGNAASIRGYFLKQSNNRFDYSSVVTAWFTAANPRDYYTTDQGVVFGVQARWLITEGLQALRDDGFDFTLCDGDNDGDVDGINCFYAGSVVNAWADDFGLWPHSSSSTWSPLSGVPGLTSASSKYQITALGAGLVIGTWCHENGHMICNFPDLYAYNASSGGAANFGYYSLMASGNYSDGQRHPNSIDSYLKLHAGWMDVVELSSSSHQRCVVQVDGNQLYRYKNPSVPKEYFTFEVRDNTGYEGPYGGSAVSVNPGTGLVVYHNKEDGSSTYSTILTPDNPNCNYTTPYEAMIVEANPTTLKTPWYDDPTPDTSDAFRLSGKSQINDTTKPALKFWDATGRNTSDGIDVHTISADGAVMTFVIGTGVPTGAAAVGLSRSTMTTFCNFGGTPDSQTFAIINSQSGTLSYNVSDNVAWLSCNVASGTATTEADLVTVSFQTSSLAAGSYVGTITVDDGGAGSRTITVNLTVHPQPTMSLSSINITTYGIAGTSGPQESFTLSNIGGGEMDYTISSTQGWLSFTPSSGSVIGEVDTVYINFDATGLAAGTYYDTITVASTEASNAPQTIPVEFVVQSTDMIVSYPDGGETLSGSTTQTLTWVSTLGGNVEIDLYKGGSLDQILVQSTPNDGSYDWIVPFGMYGTNYSIRITSVEQPSKDDDSNGDFTIATGYSFESGLDGWIQDTGDNLDWIRQSGSTPSRASNTGPLGASDGLYYLFTESSSPNYNMTANIYKDMDFSSLNEPLLRFDYHMYGSAMGALYLEVSTNSGGSWATVWSLSGNQGDAWVTADVDLSAYANMANVRLRFRGVTGTSFTSDMAFDRVCIIENATDGIRFAGPFNFVESIGVATVVVERVGDTVGAISVDYATSDGTATAGADYTATSGSLSWGDGDGAPKTIMVSILNDGVDEASQESLTITLSNPVSTTIMGANPVTRAILDDDNVAPVVNAGTNQTVYLSGDAPWSPADITTLAWYDAADTNTLWADTVGGTPATTTIAWWEDKSGNSRDLQKTAGSPSKGGTINGVHAIRAADGDCFSIASFGSGTYDIFFVMRGANSGNTVDVSLGGNNNDSYLGIAASGVTTVNMLRINGTNEPVGAAILFNGETTQSVSKRADLYNEVGTQAFLVRFANIPVLTGPIKILEAANPVWEFVGDAGEILFVASPAPEEVQKIEGYLAHKWGLATNLPPDHPYKETAPGSPSATAVLDGAVTDSAPDMAGMTSLWTFFDGPGGATVVFADDTAIDTTATFGQTGVYTLRLTADDGEAQNSDDVVITVGTSSLSVTYSGNGNDGGTVPVDSAEYQASDEVTVLGNTGNLVRTGYTFDDWNTAANGSGTPYAANDTFSISVPTTLYAQWLASTHTVTFDKQSGTGGSASVLATYGSPMPAATAPTRAGYLFGGYYTGANGTGNQYYTAAMASARNWDLLAPTTLYAKWTASYTVTFQTDGTVGATLTGSASQTVPAGTDCSAVTANAPAGYHFVNWTKAGTPYSTANPLTVVNVTETMTLVANFIKDPTITITDDGLVTEGAEAGEMILVTLADGTFADPITPANWTLAGLPAGVTKGSVTRISDTIVQIVLSGNRTVDYDSNITGMSATCVAAEVGEALVPLSANSGVTFSAINDAESIEIADDGWIQEGSENGELITVVLNGGTFAGSLNAANWTVANLPAGVTKGAVTRVNATVATIALSGNRTGTYGGVDINNVTVTCTTAEYADSTGGISLSDNIGVTLRALAAGSLVLQDGLTGYTGTRDTYIDEQSPTANFGTVSPMLLNNYSGTNPAQKKQAFLAFDLSAIPAGSTVTAVTLDLTDDGSSTSVITLYEATGAWTETNATYTSSSGLLGTNSYASVTASGTAGAAVPSLVLNAAGIAKVQSWVNTPASNYGFTIQTDLNAKNISTGLRTREHATQANRPKLTITYGVGGSNPEMTVQGQGITINSGDSTPTPADDTDFGECATGGDTVVHAFTVRNDGDAALTLSGMPIVDVTGANASDFAVTATPATSIAASNATTFQITFTPGGLGARVATVSIANNDADENPYTFAVQGKGIGAPVTYTVTYDGNTSTGGTTPVDLLSPYESGATVVVLVAGDLVKTGYTFANWNTLADGTGTGYAPSATFTITSNTTLYAQWTVSQYMLTYTAGAGGSISGTSPQTVNHGASGTEVTAVPNTGYSFVRWSDDVMTAARTDTGVTGDITVTAEFAPNTYTVTLDPQSGTGGSASVAATYGSAMPAATAPTRAGYTFGGYFTAVDGGGVQYYTTAMASARNWNLTSATTLYAQWTLVPVSVVTDLDSVNVPEGGTGSFQVKLSNQPAGAVTVTVSRSAGDADISVQSGDTLTFTTTDWDTYQTVTLAAANDADAGNGTATITCDASDAAYTDKNVTANEADKHTTLTVTNDGSGTTVPSGAVVVEKGVATGIAATANEGYNFANWSVPSGSTTFGNANAATTTATISAPATVQANFVLKTYTVSYDANGSDSGTAPLSQTKTHGIDLTLATNSGNLARTGYSFGGWNTQTNGLGADYAAGATYTGNAAMTLYVKWDIDAPAAPTGLVVTNISLGQVDLSWEGVPFADSYNIKRATASSGPYGVVDTTTGTNYSDTVANGATYYYVVSAENAGGEGPDSAEVSATLLHVVPFGEDFEGLSLGALASQNLWAASNAVVQTNLTFAGARAGAITTEVGFVEQTFAGSESKVWTDVRMQPVFCPEKPSSFDPTATAVFFFNTNGNPVVFNSTNAQVITEVTVSTGDWVRVTVYTDYTSKKWDFYVDGVSVAAGLDFYDTANTRYERLTFSGGGPSGAYLDDITVGSSSPFAGLPLFAVYSAHGSPSPAVGAASYAVDSEINAYMPDAIITNGLIRYVCTGWTGTGSGLTNDTTTNFNFTITEDTTLTWQWQTNYWVELNTAGE